MPAPHNLPVQLNSFVGREQEVTEITKLLPTYHLVTLTGPGGTGKSRLAVQVAAGLLSEFKDGIWLVELAALDKPELVAPAVARLLDVKEVLGQSLIEAIATYCRSRRLLVVLDNCEHLLDACAGLAHLLLVNCPDLRLLATSRESLNIPGEAIFNVTALTVPDPFNLPDPPQLAAYPAVRLFVERALAVQPGFKLTTENAPAVAQICCQLDGLPLALELAASRLKSLTAQQIADRLNDRFSLLNLGPRTALPRQQTLHGLINWSYELLSVKEKLLFERLAVFVGDWSLEAAEAVCAGDELAAAEILDLLSQLVSKSLIYITERQGVARYHFLETIHQFARTSLEQSGRLAAVKHNHLAWALQLAVQAGGNLWLGAAQPTWFGTLEAEHDNLRTALDWGLQNEPVVAGRLAWELTIFWETHGYLSEGRRWVDRALAHRASFEPALQAQLLFAAGWLAHRQNDFEQAEALCGDSLALFQADNDLERVLNVQLNLGWIALCRNELDQARQRLDAALLLARRLNNRYCEAAGLTYLGLVALLEGRSEEAAQMCERSVQLCQALGSSHYLGWALTGRGAAALFAGEFEQARSYFLESLRQLGQAGEKIVVPYNLVGLATIHLLQEQPLQAVRLFGKAEAWWESLGGALIPVFKPPYEMAVMYAAIQLDETALTAAWSEGREMRLDQLTGDSADLSGGRQPVEIQAAGHPENQAASQPDDIAGKSHPKVKESGKPANPAGLTGREVEVLRLLAAGKSNAQIGRELSLSTLTVNTYLRTIYSKLEVSSRNAATRRAYELGVASPDL